MGWYAKIFNYSRNEWSNYEYKWGNDVSVFKDMNWDNNDIIVGGGMGEDFILLSGNAEITQVYYDEPGLEHIVVNYKITVK